MTIRVQLFAVLTLSFAALLPASSAYAQQVQRTWLSGNGDDANPCSRYQPCKTFASALSHTATGGEIDLIDPDTAGPVTISRPVTLDGSDAGFAYVLASANNGIVVQTNGTVTLRHLRISGIGTGLDGIILKSGNLVIENCEISNFAGHGINIATAATGASKITIVDSRFIDNTGGGILIGPSAGASSVSISGVVANKNGGYGIAIGPTGSAIANVSISNTQASQNGFGIGLDTTGGSSAIASVVIDHATASGNTTNGIQATGAGATVFFGNSTLSHDGTGVTITAPAVGTTYKNNVIDQTQAGNHVVGILAIGSFE